MVADESESLIPARSFSIILASDTFTPGTDTTIFGKAWDTRKLPGLCRPSQGFLDPDGHYRCPSTDDPRLKWFTTSGNSASQQRMYTPGCRCFSALILLIALLKASFIQAIKVEHEKVERHLPGRPQPQQIIKANLSIWNPISTTSLIPSLHPMQAKQQSLWKTESGEILYQRYYRNLNALEDGI